MRPDNLPDFGEPPLNELVLGVQFEAIPGYDLINAGDVHELFRDRYPNVENRPPQPPLFETFGAPASSGGFRVDLGMPGAHPRFWFIDPSGHELLQFEAIRLLHNWRQLDGIGGHYPRFENIAEKFITELHQLDDYARKLSGTPLRINQAEVSYINRLYATESGKWPFDDLSFLALPVSEVELGGGNFQRVYQTGDGRQGRIYTEFATSMDMMGNPFLHFSQTFRGAPHVPTISGALEFIEAGRQIIVESFSKLTTEQAHARWKRIK